VIASTRQQPGYQSLSRMPETIDGFPALAWSFVAPESGVEMQKEDAFVVDTLTGSNVAVLTQAPASVYSSLAPAFQTARQSLRIN
jgi:hypothetical protein